MGFFKVLKPFFSTRRRKRSRNIYRKKNRRTRRRNIMRGGWGETFTTPIQTTSNIMRGGWGGVLPPTMANLQ